MNFMQWKGHAAKKAVAKVTYICGEESALVEIVLNDIKTILNVPVTDFISIDTKNTQGIWEQASQYSLNVDANRLIVVRNADKVENWHHLDEWLAYSRVNTNNYLVFIDPRIDAPVIFAKGKKVSYADHIEVIKTKGKFVKCSTPNDEDLINWSKTYGLSQQSAAHLVERTSGDTALMLDVFKKIHIWNGSPNTKVIDLLCEEQALDSFADYLILRQKETAYIALANMSETDKDKIISKLDQRLDMLTDIGKHVRRRMYPADIASTTGVKVFLVKRFSPVVKDYDDRKIRYCRQILTLVDGALRDGVKTGAYEVLITLW